MNTTSLGVQAEQFVAEELERLGYKILARNWKRRLCEIDIISCRDKIIVFVEVKYRSQAAQGSGLEYITPKKLKQMKFAAEIWTSEHNWSGDYRLGVASVSSEDGRLKLEELVEIN